jgi:hypothetical protein
MALPFDAENRGSSAHSSLYLLRLIWRRNTAVSMSCTVRRNAITVPWRRKT